MCISEKENIMLTGDLQSMADTGYEDGLQLAAQ
uniref:Uncharacterized protein n=1 Tax=Arundo donax TaxID=35708 RepID=A0A0A9AZF0_ARUDO